MRNQGNSQVVGGFTRTSICLLASFLLLSLASNAGDSPARTPQDVTIVQHSERGGPSTFVMSGAISDSGHVTLDSVLATALPSPVVGTAHYVRTYHGSLGTFTMQLQTIITPTDVPWLWTETGHWIIIEATGAYEGLQGQGEELGVRNFSANTLDVVFTGQVH